MPLSREQFDSTMATYEPRLRAHVLGQVGASQGLDVQEIIQEVRIRLWRVLSSEKVVEHLASYLRKTVMSVVIDSVRRNQALREDAIDDLLEHQLPAERHSVAPDKVVDSQQRVDAARKAISALPARRRVPAQLLLQGFNPQEIGQMLGLTDATARNLAYRGVDEIRAALRIAGVESWDE